MGWGTAWVYDRLDIPHAKSKAFADNFDELAQMVGDPRQLAGTILFCAALSAGGTVHVRAGGWEYMGGLRASVNWAKMTREELEQAGYTAEQVERLTAQPDGRKTELARELLQENMTKDARGWRQRVLEANAKKYAAAGSALKYSGALEVNPSSGQKISGMMRGALADAWNEQVRKGQLPAVERQADGQMKLTKYAPVTGEVEWTDTMSEEEADRYLQVFMGEDEDARRLAIRAQYGLEGEARARGGLRSAIVSAVEARAGKAMEQSVKETESETGIALEHVTEHLPEELAEAVKEKGYIDVNIAERISAWALGVIDELVGQGLTEEEALGLSKEGKKRLEAEAKAKAEEEKLRNTSFYAASNGKMPTAQRQARKWMQHSALDKYENGAVISRDLSAKLKKELRWQEGDEIVMKISRGSKTWQIPVVNTTPRNDGFIFISSKDTINMKSTRDKKLQCEGLDQITFGIIRAKDKQ